MPTAPIRPSPPAERVVWSADAFPEAERVAAWTRLVGERFVPMRVEYDGPGPFRLDATVTTLGAITLAELRGCAHRLTRITPPAHRTPTEAGHGTIFVNLQVTGRSTVRGPGKALHVAAGITGILAADWPGLVELPDDFHQLLLVLPADLLPAHITGPPASGGQLAGSPAAAGLLANSVDYLIRHGGDLDPTVTRLAVQHLLDLLELAFTPTDASAGRRGGDLLRRIHEQIDSQLHDPGLRTVHVAQALGVSARYVQQLLAGQGTTFTRLLTERRVQRCRIAFDSDPARTLSTTEIARQHGFGSLAPFSRAFTRHLGVSPRAYRTGISPPHPTDLATDAALEAPESETSSAMTIQQS